MRRGMRNGLSLSPFLVLLLVPRDVGAAADPLLGSWRLNPATSFLGDQQLRIEDLGDNKYKFTVGLASYTLTADGKEQTIHLQATPKYGAAEFTESVAKLGPNRWKVELKQAGRVSDSTWALAEDGKTLRMQRGGDSQTPADRQLMYRLEGGAGFAGWWESRQPKEKLTNVPAEIDVAAYKNTGYSFVFPFEKVIQRVEFDDKDHAQEGLRARPGVTWCGKRHDARTLQITAKTNGEVSNQTEIQVSPNGNTLTLKITDNSTGQGPSELVYTRESIPAEAVAVLTGITNGVAVGKNGDLLITDAGCVKRIVRNVNARVRVACGLNSPMGVEEGGDGDIFIADTQNNRVLKVTPDGVQTPVGHDLKQPESVAVDGRGNIIVAQLNSREIVKITSDGQQTTILPPGDYAIGGIAVTPAGAWLIADTDYHRVIQVTGGGEDAKTVPAVGLCRPSAVAVDGSGDIFIADAGNERVVEVTANGRQRVVLSGLKKPSALAVDQAGHLFVADNPVLLEVSLRGGNP